MSYYNRPSSQLYYLNIYDIKNNRKSEYTGYENSVVERIISRLYGDYTFRRKKAFQIFYKIKTGGVFSYGNLRIFISPRRRR